MGERLYVFRALVAYHGAIHQSRALAMSQWVRSSPGYFARMFPDGTGTVESDAGTFPFRWTVAPALEDFTAEILEQQRHRLRLAAQADPTVQEYLDAAAELVAQQ